MWLEEFAWFWAPVVGGIGLWMFRRVVSLSAEVRRLHQRIAELEHTSVAHGPHKRNVA